MCQQEHSRETIEKGESFRLWKGTARMGIGFLIRIPTDSFSLYSSSSAICLWLLRKGRKKEESGETRKGDCVRR